MKRKKIQNEYKQYCRKSRESSLEKSRSKSKLAKLRESEKERDEVDSFAYLMQKHKQVYNMPTLLSQKQRYQYSAFNLLKEPSYQDLPSLRNMKEMNNSDISMTMKVNGDTSMILPYEDPYKQHAQTEKKDL